MAKQALLAVVMLFAACTRATGGTAPSEIPSNPTSAQQPDEGLPFVRTCESSVYGDLGQDWRRGQIAAGSVVFVGASGYANDPAERFRAAANLATSQKVLVVVRGGRPVEVSVRQPGAALAYDPARWGDRNVVPFRRGDPAVRFEPCGGDQRWTQFNGAFLLRRPACVSVVVRPQDASPIFVTIPFGAADRC